MQNKHLEHIEDSILTGDLSAIDLLYDPAHISVKMDGAPAIVWGNDPATNTFFVGTKAVFNKKKVRIAHSHDEIDQLYDGEVAEILHACFKYIPRQKGNPAIYQGDFIGFGNGTTFTPNTIRYTFSEFIPQKVIIAPHTFYYDYYGSSKMCDLVAFPIMQMFDNHPKIKWVQPSVDRVRGNATFPNINTRMIQFLSEDAAKTCKIIINSFIRGGTPLSDELLTNIFGCPHLANLYQMVIEMKEEFADSLIISDAPVSSIPTSFGWGNIKQEGFVIWSEESTAVKIVDREIFSHANFNNLKFS